MRSRFYPPALTNPGDLAQIDLTINAGFTDSRDVLPASGDYSYWRGNWNTLISRGKELLYKGDPTGVYYAWDRIIGYQAGGPDVSPYGPFAQPPNNGPVGGWKTPFFDITGTTQPPVDPPVDPPPTNLGPVLALLVEMNAKLDTIGLDVSALQTSQIALINAVAALTKSNERIEAALTRIEQTQAKGLGGRVWGMQVRLTP